MNPLDKLQFSYNWNGKLDSKCFTTLRLRNAIKFEVGNCFEIWLKDEYKGQARIVDVKHLLLDQINGWIARLDTGYDAEKCTELIRTMYKTKSIDWSKQQLAYVLLEKYTLNP